MSKVNGGQACVDVLKAAGAKGEMVTMTALDGYAK